MAKFEDYTKTISSMLKEELMQYHFSFVIINFKKQNIVPNLRDQIKISQCFFNLNFLTMGEGFGQFKVLHHRSPGPIIYV